jgi:type IV pilus assembly protein PilM
MSAVGLNLSSFQISLIELIKARKDFTIKNLVIDEIPVEAIERGEIKDASILTTGLKEIWRKNKISDKKVFIGIANQKVIAKEVQIPVLDDNEINNSIKYQISDFIPIPKNNIIYDYYIIEKSENASKLMLVGTLKSMINDIAKSFKDAGLFAQVIDLNCFALYRTLDYIYKLEKNKGGKELSSFCAVNIGSDISIFEIIQANELRYPRFTSSSIRSFIDKIYKINQNEEYCRKVVSEFDFRQLLGADIQEDKRKSKKESTGKSAGGEDKESSKKPEKEEEKNVIDDTQIARIMKDAADQFIYEIRLSIENFLQENPKFKIDKIILSGHYIKNIEKYIEREINYKVELLKISDYFSLNYIRKNPLFKDKDLNHIIDPIAAGMALRGLNK